MPGNNTDAAGHFSPNDTSNPLCSYPSTPEELSHFQALLEASVILVDVVFSIALALGLPGSVFTVITIVSSSAVSPATLYICTLAVSDLVSLILASFTAYKLTDLLVSPTQQDIVTIYLTRIFQSFSHWLLALICLERFVSIRFPVQKSRIFSTKTVILSIVIAFLLGAAPLPVILFSHLKYNFNHNELEVAGTTLHHLLYVVLPGMFIAIFSLLSALRLKHQARLMETMMSSRKSQRTVTMETQLSRIMFFTVACFVLSTFPFAAISIFDRIWRHLVGNNKDCVARDSVHFFLSIFLWAFSFLNNAVNFYVYYICATGFRDKFKRIICCKKKGVPNDIELQTNS